MNKSTGIRTYLLMGFASITAIFLVAIVITLSMVYSIKKFTNHVTTVELPSYDKILELNGSLYKSELALQAWVLTGDAKYKTLFNSNWSDAIQRVAQLEEYNSKDKAVEKYFVIAWQATKESLDKLKVVQSTALGMTDKSLATHYLRDQVEPVFDIAESNFNSIHDYNSNNFAIAKMQKLRDDTDIIANNLNNLLMIQYFLAGLGVISAFCIASLTARKISRHIDSYREHSARIAAGDLTHLITVEGHDELGQLGSDLNTMTESLAGISREITQACHSMVSTLDEVRHAVDSQAAGASEQASSINEITASVGEIEKSTAQTMEKAKTLGEIAERTRAKGELGMDAIEQSVLGMQSVREKVQIIAQTILDLSNQTKQVGEITSVVNNLAQQSKMLALNASIEAAKAGESGKGFAVVAAEVKNLAEQSEQSTDQVQKILEDIKHATEKAVMATEEGTKGVDLGTDLVEQTGEIIRSLNDVIHETTIATQQIEAAVRQESAGIEQITAGMNEINQVTSSFVQSSRQTTEAMDNLSKVAKDLKKHVDVYKM